MGLISFPGRTDCNGRTRVDGENKDTPTLLRWIFQSPFVYLAKSTFLDRGQSSSSVGGKKISQRGFAIAQSQVSPSQKELQLLYFEKSKNFNQYPKSYASDLGKFKK